MDVATRMTVDSSGNVGIGTTSPNALFEVARSSDGLDDVHFNGQVRIDGADPSRLTLGATNSANLWSVDNATGTLRFFRENWSATGSGTSGAVRMSITDAGHVSIPNSIHSPGLVVAMYEFWDNTANRSVTSSPQNIHLQTITTQGNTRLIFQVVTGQFIKSTSLTNLQLRFWVDGSQVSFGDQMLDTDHIGYGQSAMREQMVQVGNTDTLSAGAHTVEVRASAYNTGNTITLNYQSSGRSSHFFVWEVCT